MNIGIVTTAGYEFVVITMESYKESEMLDAIFGNRVDGSDLISKIKGEVRVSKNGTHYLKLVKDDSNSSSA